MICPCKICNLWLQSVKMTLYIYDMSFLLMMFWCEVCAIYILIKSVQFLCIKHEYSCMLFKTISQLNIWDIEYLQISFTLTISCNSCNYYMNLWKTNFTQNLHEFLKCHKFVMKGKKNKGETYKNTGQVWRSR